MVVTSVVDPQAVAWVWDSWLMILMAC